MLVAVQVSSTDTSRSGSQWEWEEILPGSATDSLQTLVFYRACQALFMLVAALMGLDRMQAAYAHAIGGGYRFYSYGDASLLIPQGPSGGLQVDA